MILTHGLIIGNNMSSKRIQAIKYYLMTDAEKKRVMNILSNDVINQLIEFSKELDGIIPKNFSEKEKKYLLEKIANSSNSSDYVWQQFSESVTKKMSLLGVFPSKLRQALVE